MKRLILITGLLIAVLSVPILSEAAPVFINNSGFETDFLADGSWNFDITGWPNSGEAGVWNTPAGYFSTGIPEGDNVAYLNWSSASISQQLSYTLIADTTLTLSVDVGWRLYMPLPGYEVQLWAVDDSGNRNYLTSESSLSLVQGGFVTSVLSYDVTNKFLGQNLEIVLLKTGGIQVNFDNVRLNNDPTAVPEPSTLLLLGSGLVGLGYFIRRRRG